MRDIKDLEDWLLEHQIEDVECLIPDMSGIMRGKIQSAQKFLEACKDGSLRIPEEIFNQTVTGDYAPEGITSMTDMDVALTPDIETIRTIPWYPTPTAQVVCDAHYVNNDEIVDIAPRTVLKRIIKLYKDIGLKVSIAPEMEFYLIQKNPDPDLPLEVPIGISGRQVAGRQAYGIEAANEYDPIIDDVYDFCELSHIDIDTMIHESGPGQMELNFNHGDPLALADQVFLFKRTVRQAALKHGICATFMAKPHAGHPGSSMHLHQSVINLETGHNIFATKSGKDSAKLMNYIGGLQRYISAAMPLFATNVNSYRRITPYSDAPINVHWGHDNRTVGLRVPNSSANSRRVENRIPGSDANPYLAFAGSMACGYLGLIRRHKATREVLGDAYKLAYSLPRSQHEALSKLTHSKPLKELLGDRFIRCFNEVKLYEYQQFSSVISSWERENLLLNV